MSMATDTPVWQWSATSLATAIRGKRLSSQDVVQAHLDRIAQEWDLFLKRYPLVLGPVSTMQPFDVGYDISGPEQMKYFFQSIGLTEVCNLLGLPSVAVPVQVVDGLPQGVQLIGRRYHEDLCFDAAEAIERQQGVLTPIEPRQTVN